MTDHSAAPVLAMHTGLDVDHSVLPLRMRTTKVRSVVAATLLLGTNSDGAERWIGHRT